MLRSGLSRLRGGAGEISPTGFYAMGTRLAAALYVFVGGVLLILMVDAGRIGVFLSLSSLTAFSAVGDLGLTYSFLLAASSRTDKGQPLLAAAVAAAVPSVAATGTLLFLGGALFMGRGDVDAAYWLWPWAGYCVTSSIQMLLGLPFAYLEGTGRRHQAWRVYFLMEVVAGIAFLAAMLLHVELWALAAASATRVVLMLLVLAWFVDVPRDAPGPRFATWREQLWPMQWKTLVNTLAGLLATRLLTPLLLAMQGAAAAGQMGLILAGGLLITTVTAVWPFSQTAVYAALYHRRQGRELDALFRRTLTATTALSVAGVVLAGGLCEVLREISPHMAARLPGSTVTWLILAAAPFAHVSQCCALVLRSQRHDPVAVVNLALTVPALAVYALAARAGAMAFGWTYLAATVGFMLLYLAFLLPFLRRLRALDG